MLGAEVDTDLDSDQYRWETDGNGEKCLVEIEWPKVGLENKISFANLKNLRDLDCGLNNLMIYDN